MGRGVPGRTDLGLHPAGSPVGPRALGQSLNGRVNPVYTANELAFTIFRMPGHKPIDIREHYEEIGFNFNGDSRGQGIIVAEADFFHPNAIVFINNRNDPLP